MAKKILYIDTSLGFGGATVSLSNLSTEIHNANYNVSIAFLFQKKNKILENYFKNRKVNLIFLRNFSTYIFLKLDTLISSLETKNFLLSIISFLNKFVFDRIFTFFKILLLLKTNQFDLIHLNNGISYPIILAAYFARVPCLVSIRSFLIVRGYNKFILNKVIFFVANSIAVKNDFLSKIKIDENKVKVIYNPINTTAILSKINRSRDQVKNELGINSSYRIIGTAGRLWSWKRQDLLISITEKLLKDNWKIKCIIVGGPDNSLDSQEYANSLKIIVKSKNLNSDIIFTGFCRNPFEVMQIFDVFVLPSITEPFGNVVIEAMALKIPVVAFNAGGPSEIIDNEINGFLAPVGNIDSMVQYINMLFKKNEYYKQISNNAYKKINDCFGLKKSINKFMNLYELATLDRVN